MSAGVQPLITAIGEDHTRVAEDRESLRRRVVELEHVLDNVRRAHNLADTVLTSGQPSSRSQQSER